jgi:hypothetical protein
MARFQIQDTIQLIKLNREVVREGVITYGPTKVDKVDHYRVKWSDETQEQIIADLVSQKYHYRLK